MMNSMLNSSKLPHNLWGEANKSPYELWKRRILTYKILKVWGCIEKVLIPLPKKTKLGPKMVNSVVDVPFSPGYLFRFNVCLDLGPVYV